MTTYCPVPARWLAALLLIAGAAQAQQPQAGNIHQLEMQWKRFKEREKQAVESRDTKLLEQQKARHSAISGAAPAPKQP